MNNKIYESLQSVDDRPGSGEVTTPLELINEMLDKLPPDTWTDETKTFLDPCFGNGTFLVEIIKRLRSHGHSMENIQERIYGYELSLRLFNKVQKLLSHYNFSILYNNNFLNTSTDMKFDVVIGNPPYNDSDTKQKESNMRGQGRNLAKLFLEKAFSIIKENSGKIAFVLPYKRTLNYKNCYRSAVSNGLYEVRDSDSYFPGVKIKSKIVSVFIDRSKIGSEIINELDDSNILATNPISKHYSFSTGKNLTRKYIEPLLSDSGRYKVYVTTSIIRYTDDINLINEISDQTINRWRVAFNHMGSSKSIGKILLVPPGDTLTYSVDALVYNTENEAIEAIKHLNSQEVKDIIHEHKNSPTNSMASCFNYIEDI